MAFSTIASGQIAAGEATKQELFQKIKDNFDDHESRILTTESSLTDLRSIDFEIVGFLSDLRVDTNVMLYRVTQNLTITGARLLVQVAGTSGTTQFDIQRKRGAGAFASIFSTQPSVAFGAGDIALSTNALLSLTDLLDGDYLRFDISSLQAGGAYGATLQLEVEAA